MYIAIEGNIGAGKSTIAKALAKKLNAHFLPEKFEENTLLPLFYENKKKLALLTELSFLIERQNQLSTFFKNSTHKIVVSDFHLDKCICFAKANLNEHDYKIYKKNFLVIKETLPEPDLVIYIDVETHLLLNNIKIRNRGMEQKIKASYLNKVSKAFENHYKLNQKKLKQFLILPIKNYTKQTTNECCDVIINALSLK